MSAKPIRRLAVKTGEYVNAQNETKGRWLNIGTMFKHDDGNISIKLEALPVGMSGWEGWVSCFPIDNNQQNQNQGQAQQSRPAQQQTQPASQAAPVDDSFDEDIPF